MLFINSLPKDVQQLIGEMVHNHLLKKIHLEFKKTYKVGVSTLIVRNDGVGTRRRRRKVFAFISVDSRFGMDSPRNCKFYEISKNIVNVPQVKGWERNPFNYRNIGSRFFDDHQYENFNPSIFCIRNNDKNVAVLPQRYFYSKPIHLRKYNRFKKTVNQFIKLMPTSKSIRGGDL